MGVWRTRRSLSCRAVGRLVQTFLDGEITDDRVVLVADHLARCGRCGSDATAYGRLKVRLSRLATPLAPRELDRLRAFADDLA